MPSMAPLRRSDCHFCLDVYYFARACRHDYFGETRLTDLIWPVVDIRKREIGVSRKNHDSIVGNGWR